MLRLIPYIAVLVVVVYALVDCLRTPEQAVRNLPKWAWVLVIAIFWVLGAVGWFLAGRPRPGTGGNLSYGGRGQPPAPIAPDDDPEFLRFLEQQRRRRQGRPGEPPSPDAN